MKNPEETVPVVSLKKELPFDAAPVTTSGMVESTVPPSHIRDGVAVGVQASPEFGSGVLCDLHQDGPPVGGMRGRILTDPQLWRCRIGLQPHR